MSSLRAKTSGDNCQWCKYPILEGRVARRRKIQKQAKREAGLAAKEEAKRKTEDTRKAKEAQKQAEKEAKLAAKEVTNREAQEAKEIKQVEKTQNR